MWLLKYKRNINPGGQDANRIYEPLLGDKNTIKTQNSDNNPEISEHQSNITGINVLCFLRSTW